MTTEIELWYNKGIEKGKLEERERVLKIIDERIKNINSKFIDKDEILEKKINNFVFIIQTAFKEELGELKKQLQKEIGGNGE